MNKTEAVICLICEGMKPKATKTAYKRVCKAIKVLEIPEDEQWEVLHTLCYSDIDGKPYGFLTQGETK